MKQKSILVHLSRLSFSSRFFALGAALLALPLTGNGHAADAATPASAPAASKPNLIIILVDDMGYGDIDLFNPAAKNKTPNIDKMAAEGMKLTSFYGCNVCTPSRAQFISGCYAQRVGLPVVIAPGCPIGLSSKEHTIADLLKAQGYATYAIGKWHLGDQPQFLPVYRGFDHYFGLPYSNDMGGEWDGLNGEPGGKHRPPLPLVQDDKVIQQVKPDDQDYLTEAYTEHAEKFIKDHQKSPFFLYLAHTAVHTPIHPGPDFKGHSQNGHYGDWVEEMDASTGRILDLLKKLNLDKNTLVVLTSDNGPWLVKKADGGNAGPLRGGKFSTWEGGLREPTVAWWPGHIPAGTSSDEICANLDLLPTFVAAAGGTIPTDRKIDGLDLLPLLTGETKDSPHEAYYYFQGWNLQDVRSGPWKLRLVGDPKVPLDAEGDPKNKGAKGPPTLYNLDTDVGERTDVSAAHPDIVAKLKALAAKMDADIGSGEHGGPGRRPPDRVAKPKVLLPDHPITTNGLKDSYDAVKP